MTERKKVNIYFAIALIIAFILAWLAQYSLGDTIETAIISSALTLGVIIPWITFNVRTKKSSQTATSSESKDDIRSGSDGIGTNAAWEIVKTIIGVALFVVFFRFFIIQPFYIVGSSMLPDFHDGQYLFIDEASYYLKAPERGEVIVFRHPTVVCSAFVESHKLIKTIVQGPCQSYIKRIVGLPGETVDIKDGQVKIINSANPNGFVLNEKYIEQGVPTLGTLNVKLGSDEYFVLGDNREPDASSDSREWGSLKREFIIGRAWVSLLPINDIGFIQKANY